MIRTLQSLRFVFVMLVVASHVVGGQFDFGGDCGVAFFFMLSGFVLSVGYAEKIHQGLFRQREFCLRQLLKFYPLHLATFLLMTLLDARLGMVSEWYKQVLCLLLVQSWIPDESFFFVANGPSWFLADMVFFYLVFRLLFRWLTSLPLRWLVLAACALAVAYLLLAFCLPLRMVNSVLYVHPLLRVLDFALGILLYRVYRWRLGRRHHACDSTTVPLKSDFVIAPKISPLGGTWAELLMVGLVGLAFLAYQWLPAGLRCVALFWMVLPWLILFFAEADRHPGKLSRFLQRPVMLWLGGLSFEVYLLHLPLLRVGYSLGAAVGMPRVASLVIVLPVLVAVSWIVKKYFVDKIYGFLIKRVI